MTQTLTAQLKSGQMLSIELSEEQIDSLDAISHQTKLLGSLRTFWNSEVRARADSSGNLVLQLSDDSDWLRCKIVPASA